MQILQLCIFPVWIVRGFPECSGLGRVVAVAVTKQMWRRWCGIICECKICYLCSAMACHCSLTSCLATIRWNIISPDQTQCPGPLPVPPLAYLHLAYALCRLTAAAQGVPEILISKYHTHLGSQNTKWQNNKFYITFYHDWHRYSRGGRRRWSVDSKQSAAPTHW